VLSLAEFFLVVLCQQISDGVMLLLDISAKFQIFRMVLRKDLFIVCIMLYIDLPVIFMGD